MLVNKLKKKAAPYRPPIRGGEGDTLTYGFSMSHGMMEWRKRNT